MREVYAFDIDGCQNDYHKYLINVGSRYLARRDLLHGVNRTRYTLSEVFGVSEEVQEEFYDFTDYYFFCIIGARLYCSEVMQRIAKQADIVMITGRDESKLIKGTNFTQGQATHKWFIEHAIPYNKLIFTHDKAEACKRVGAKLIVEDAPMYLEGIQNAGIDYIVFDAEYNRDHEGKRAHSWYEVLHHLELIKKGGLLCNI